MRQLQKENISNRNNKIELTDENMLKLIHQYEVDRIQNDIHKSLSLLQANKDNNKVNEYLEIIELLKKIKKFIEII